MSGFQGKRNIYTCDRCHGHVVTWDRDDGVTPFMITCRAGDGCRGMMTSSMYRVFDQTMRPGFEWYRPASAAGLAAAVRDHVERGGLLLRPFDGDNPPAAERDPPPTPMPAEPELDAAIDKALRGISR